jgi:hypothetical protein
MCYMDTGQPAGRTRSRRCWQVGCGSKTGCVRVRRAYQCSKVNDVPTHSHSGVVSHHKLLIVCVFLICKERASATQKRSRLIKIRGAALEAVGGAAVSPATRRHGCYLLRGRRPSTAIFLPLRRHTAHESPNPPSVAYVSRIQRQMYAVRTTRDIRSSESRQSRGGAGA